MIVNLDYPSTRTSATGAVESPQLIGATGEMADLVRAHDWRSTPLGPIEKWSKDLLAIVNMALSTPVPTLIYWGPEMTLLYNDSFRPFTSTKHPRSLGRPGNEVWAEAWDIIGPQFESVLETGEKTYRENFLIPLENDGKLHDYYWNYSTSPLYEGGRLAGLVVICQDQTAAVLAKRERDAMAEQLNQVLDATTDSVLSIGRDWRITYMNGSAKKSAAPIQDVVGKNFWESFPAAAYEGSPYVEHYHRAMNERIAANFEAFYPDPLNIWTQVQVRPSADGIVLFFRDVTEQKRKQAALHESYELAQLALDGQKSAAAALMQNETKLRLAAEAAQLGVYTWHVAEDRIEWETDRVYEIFGRTPEDGPINAAQFAAEIVHPDYAAAFRQAVEETLRTGSRFVFQGMFYRKDRTAGWVEFTGQLEYASDGTPFRMLGTALDITMRKQSEETLRTTEKLAATGRLAASIAHEVNNPLESVTNLLYLARHSEDIAEVHQHLDVAERELRRVAAITNQTLRFHRESKNPVSVTCQHLFEEALSIYQGRLVNSRVAVEKRKRAKHPVICFEGGIRQVLANLIGNAIDAMPGGGRLLIRSREATEWKNGRKGLALTIADTGGGIAPAALKRIFDPFFTTKGNSGTGLGLWVSQGIVARNLGALRVRSSQRHGASGTVFTLFLPFEAKTPDPSRQGAAVTIGNSTKLALPGA